MVGQGVVPSYRFRMVFLPAVSLSMARGAWVGHIGGAVGVVSCF